MTINSKVDICNMTLYHLGNYDDVNDIDTPVTDKERTFALWFDIGRQTLLKLVMPNFSLDREVVSKLASTPDFGWAYEYEYPVTALKVLGIGSVEDKKNNYAIENNGSGLVVRSNELYEAGLPIRIIRDVTDVNSWSPEFKLMLSWWLAPLVGMAITQDAGRVAQIEKMMPEKLSSVSSVNAQENMPIRISNSKFRAARYSNNPTFTEKS